MLGAKNSVSSRRQASWPATKRSKACSSSANSGVPSSRAQREVDVARVALALVELGHEGDRHALLGGDLLGAGLVDRVLVGGRAAPAVGEVDLVLAEVALALGVLHPQARAGHRVADAADQRLDPRGAEHRVVDVVEVGRVEVAVAAVAAPPRRMSLKRMNSSSVAAFASSPRSARRSSWRRRIWRGEATTGLPSRPREVGQAQRGALVPRHRAQRVEVGLHLEVAVAAFP